MELTPAQIDAQNESRRKLRVVREEGLSFDSRRDDIMAEARLNALSLRDIGKCVGLSPSSVKEHLDRMDIQLPAWAQTQELDE